jgi:hypothetical protein
MKHLQQHVLVICIVNPIQKLYVLKLSCQLSCLFKVNRLRQAAFLLLSNNCGGTSCPSFLSLVIYQIHRLFASLSESCPFLLYCILVSAFLYTTASLPPSFRPPSPPVIISNPLLLERPISFLWLLSMGTRLSCPFLLVLCQLTVSCTRPSPPPPPHLPYSPFSYQPSYLF